MIDMYHVKSSQHMQDTGVKFFVISNITSYNQPSANWHWFVWLLFSLRDCNYQVLLLHDICSTSVETCCKLSLIFGLFLLFWQYVHLVIKLAFGFAVSSPCWPIRVGRGLGTVYPLKNSNARRMCGLIPWWAISSLLTKLFGSGSVLSWACEGY